MASGERAEFKNPVVNWIDERMPVFTMMQKEYGTFPTPKNFNYFWNFGAIATVMLVVMIVTGLFWLCIIPLMPTMLSAVSSALCVM